MVPLPVVRRGGLFQQPAPVVRAAADTVSVHRNQKLQPAAKHRQRRHRLCAQAPALCGCTADLLAAPDDLMDEQDAHRHCASRRGQRARTLPPDVNGQSRVRRRQRHCDGAEDLVDNHRGCVAPRGHTAKQVHQPGAVGAKRLEGRAHEVQKTGGGAAVAERPALPIADRSQQLTHRALELVTRERAAAIRACDVQRAALRRALGAAQQPRQQGQERRLPLHVHDIRVGPAQQETPEHILEDSRRQHLVRGVREPHKLREGIVRAQVLRAVHTLVEEHCPTTHNRRQRNVSAGRNGGSRSTPDERRRQVLAYGQSLRRAPRARA